MGFLMSIREFTIPPDKTCYVEDDYTIDSFVIEKDGGDIGVLIIEEGNTLSVENDEDQCATCSEQDIDHIVDGEMIIEDDAALVFLDEDHLIEGTGAITGETTDSTFQVNAGAEVTSQLAVADMGIRGSLDMVGGPTGAAARVFINEGLVFSPGGHINLGPTLDLEDIQGAVWMVACGDPDGLGLQSGEMQFKRQELGLLGDFREPRNEPGEFIFDASVKTCGTYFRWGCGGITINNSSTFSYASFDGGSIPCPNPKDVDGTEDDCEDPWVVETTKSPIHQCFGGD